MSEEEIKKGWEESREPFDEEEIKKELEDIRQGMTQLEDSIGGELVAIRGVLGLTFRLALILAPNDTRRLCIEQIKDLEIGPGSDLTKEEFNRFKEIFIQEIPDSFTENPSNELSD